MNVLVAPGSVVAALAAKAATTTVPIVFETGADPVAVGLVGSLNRPGANVTGVTSLNTEIGPKRLELLHQLVPKASGFALLVNPMNAGNTETTTKELQKAARTLGLQILVLNASTDRDLDEVFTTLAQKQVGGLVITNEIFFSGRSGRLAELALRHSLPAVHQAREFAVAGGLMSYGGSFMQSHTQAGVYAGRILNGEKPANLPVQQITKVELVINLKTAKALGLTVPLDILGRADEVIE